MSNWLRWSLYAVLAAFGLLAVAGTVTAMLWRDRAPLSGLSWPIVETMAETDGNVTVTWLGITSLLFDDGETQILIDGTFTRIGLPNLMLPRKYGSDIATINYAMDEFRIERLAAIVPLHSHFDHAMDAGRVANRSSAVLLGSESTANIARGAGVPVDQYQILADGESRVFGNFTITLLESAHAPIGSGGGWFAGVIDEPLAQPAWIWSWRGGAAYSVLIAHPEGNALIQGSAGFVEGKLAEQRADVVFLSVAGLAALGRTYTERYWQETVTATGAARAFALHFDDFTLPLGDIRLFPNVVDKVVESAAWIDEFAAESNVPVYRLPFGLPVTLYPQPPQTAQQPVPAYP